MTKQSESSCKQVN